MSTAVKQWLEAYDRLSEEDRSELTREILRRAIAEDLPPLNDETLDQLADETFAELDAREAADG